MITTIDQRGEKYNPRLCIGFPRDNRRLVAGLSGPGICPDGEDYDSTIHRVRANLRGKRDAVIVLHNYSVDGYAAMED